MIIQSGVIGGKQFVHRSLADTDGDNTPDATTPEVESVVDGTPLDLSDTTDK